MLSAHEILNPDLFSYIRSLGLIICCFLGEKVKCLFFTLNVCCTSFFDCTYMYVNNFFLPKAVVNRRLLYNMD
jgi:hypothetical protein